MFIDVTLVPAEIGEHQALADCAVIVIDVLRATSTIVTALDAGANSVVTVADVEEARTLAKALGEGSVLGGERGGVALPGFQLGNSPLEYTADKVAGKTVILTTTNGTYTLHRSSSAAAVAVAAFINLDAAACWAAQRLEKGYKLILACAGTRRRFSWEDACCAGAIVERLRREQSGSLESTDGALAAEQLWIAAGRDPHRVLKGSSHGVRLLELGFADDIAYCAQASRTNSVPQLRDKRLVLK
ncbi:MAG: 2-phosphosulfolactate phosphatase [Limnochordia bacterium]